MLLYFIADFYILYDFKSFNQVHEEINVRLLRIPLYLGILEDGDLFAETFRRVEAYIWHFCLCN